MFLYVYFFYQYPSLPNIFINYSSSLSYAHPYQYTYTHQPPPHPLTGFIALYPHKSSHTHPSVQNYPSNPNHYDYSHSLVTAGHNIISLFIRIHILSIYPTIELILALIHQCQRLHSLLFLNGLSLLPWPYSSMCLLFAYSESYVCQSRTSQ